MIPSILVGSALLLLFSPWALSYAVRILAGDLPQTASKPAVISYQSAMANLANVRQRLLRTQELDDKTKAAIDTLTMALVAGSDQ